MLEVAKSTTFGNRFLVVVEHRKFWVTWVQEYYTESEPIFPGHYRWYRSGSGDSVRDGKMIRFLNSSTQGFR